MTITTGRRTTPAAAPLHADWRNQAACRDYDPELFFPVGTTGPAAVQIQGAKRVCADCPVRDECLAWSLKTRQVSGVWGGLSEDERRRLLRRYSKAAARGRGGMSAAEHIVASRMDDLRDYQDQGLSGKELAEAMGVSVQTLDIVRQMIASAPTVVEEHAAEAFLRGEAQVLRTREEELAAIVVGVGRGMTYLEIDKARRVRKDTTSQFVSRMRKRYAQDGRPFPRGLQRAAARFTDVEVVQIRELYAKGGVTDQDLCLKYDVTRKTITQLLSGESYRAAGGPIRARRNGQARQPREATRVLWAGGQAGFAAAS